MSKLKSAICLFTFAMAGLLVVPVVRAHCPGSPVQLQPDAAEGVKRTAKFLPIVFVSSTAPVDSQRIKVNSPEEIGRLFDSW